jgi:hypothetical protein
MEGHPYGPRGRAPVKVGGKSARTVQSGRGLIKPVGNPLRSLRVVPAPIGGSPGPNYAVNLSIHRLRVLVGDRGIGIAVIRGPGPTRGSG